MKLEDIGFYTLSNKRTENVSINSPLIRGEIILTDRCNLKCPYCRGLKKELQGELDYNYVRDIIHKWAYHGLENIRFSGGEPTLYKDLIELVRFCKNRGVKRVAISTNGTKPLEYYEELVDAGVNDFSISLDGGCCSVSDKMTGGVDTFDVVSSNINKLARYTYVTVGVVFNELNVDNAYNTVMYVDSLNPSDIRIISSAQYNKALTNLLRLPEDVLSRHPILNYRIQNYKNSKNVRGIGKHDCTKCHIVKDDIAVAGEYHFPCIIYLREGGNPIGKMGRNFRKERFKWFENHNTHTDRICLGNCLDVCSTHNNKVDDYVRKNEC